MSSSHGVNWIPSYTRFFLSPTQVCPPNGISIGAQHTNQATCNICNNRPTSMHGMQVMRSKELKSESVEPMRTAPVQTEGSKYRVKSFPVKSYPHQLVPCHLVPKSSHTQYQLVLMSTHIQGPNPNPNPNPNSNPWVRVGIGMR